MEIKIKNRMKKDIKNKTELKMEIKIKNRMKKINKKGVKNNNKKTTTSKIKLEINMKIRIKINIKSNKYVIRNEFGDENQMQNKRLIITWRLWATIVMTNFLMIFLLFSLYSNCRNFRNNDAMEELLVHRVINRCRIPSAPNFL